MSFHDDCADLSPDQLERLERLTPSPRARLERALHVLSADEIADLAALAEEAARQRLAVCRSFDAGEVPAPPSAPRGRLVGAERGQS